MGSQDIIGGNSFDERVDLEVGAQSDEPKGEQVGTQQDEPVGDHVCTQHEGNPSRGVSALELGAVVASDLSFGWPVLAETNMMGDASWVEDVGPCCSPPSSEAVVEMVKCLKKMLSPVRLFSILFFFACGVPVFLYACIEFG